MNKKLLLKICAIVLAVVVVGAAAVVIINNVGTTKVFLTDNKAMVGDTVEIPLEIKKNHGILAAQAYIEYDSDNLSFVSCKNGEVFDICLVNADDGCLSIILEMNEDKETSKDGLIATLSFKAKISADKADYSLKFNDECMFIDYDANIVDINYTDGKITVK